MADAYLKVKDNGASGLELVREDVESVKNTLGINGFLSPVEWSPTIKKGEYLKSENPNGGKAYASTAYARTDSLWYGYNTKAAFLMDSTTYEMNILYYDDTGTTEGVGYLNEHSAYANSVIMYVPDNAAKVGLNFRRTDNANLSDDDIAAISAALKAYAYADTTLTFSGVSAESKTVGDLLRQIPNVREYSTNPYGKYGILPGYYDSDGTRHPNAAKHACTYKLDRFGDRIIKVKVGEEYQLTVKMWDSEGTVDIKANPYMSEAIFYVPDGWKFACNFRSESRTELDEDDLAEIADTFEIYGNVTAAMIDQEDFYVGNDVLRMAENPEAIPVGSNHLGYNDFMAATWETLLPDGYQDGDAYNANTTKILNVQVSRESSWTSTPYGSNTDTYTIYRYTFTPQYGYQKTVFLSAGCHGNEAEGYWGLFRLIKMIYFEGYKYPSLRNLRNVRFIIVPCWNPWGMQNYRRYNAFEDKYLQAWCWLYEPSHSITVDGVVYDIEDVGEAKVILDTVTEYEDKIDLWLDIHTDPYAGRTTSAGEIDDPRGYTPPYGCYGYTKKNGAALNGLLNVMEDFYYIMKNEFSFSETWHLQQKDPGNTTFTGWMATLGFPNALVEISTFMENFPNASGSAGIMKLAQEFYANCLSNMI